MPPIWVLRVLHMPTRAHICSGKPILMWSLWTPFWFINSSVILECLTSTQPTLTNHCPTIQLKLPTCVEWRKYSSISLWPGKFDACGLKLNWISLTYYVVSFNSDMSTSNLLPVEWRPIEENRLNFVELLASDVTRGVSPYQQRFDFWDQVYAQMQQNWNS